MGELAFGAFVWQRTRGMSKVKRDLQFVNDKLQASEQEKQLLHRRIETITKNLKDCIAGKECSYDKLTEPENTLSAFIPYIKEKRPRWGAPAVIRFGHLEYAPFLKHADNGRPEGPALDILNKLLAPVLKTGQVTIRAEAKRRNWGNIVDGLVSGEYDIVATPLFATFDRSRKVRFTAPLFYSNIGLYVNSEHARDSVWDDLTEDTLQKSILERCGHLKFLSVEGEISQKLASKYTSKIEPRSGDFSFVSLFDELASEQSDYALFCESFRAELDPRVGNDRGKAVENVLRKVRIWYPVCFAVRIGDYQLANLLNLLLLQFHQGDNVLDCLARSIAHIPDPTTDQERKSVEDLKGMLRKHFVSEWPSASEKMEALRA